MKTGLGRPSKVPGPSQKGLLGHKHKNKVPPRITEKPQAFKMGHNQPAGVRVRKGTACQGMAGTTVWLRSQGCRLKQEERGIELGRALKVKPGQSGPNAMLKLKRLVELCYEQVEAAGTERENKKRGEKERGMVATHTNTHYSWDRVHVGLARL